MNQKLRQLYKNIEKHKVAAANWPKSENRMGVSDFLEGDFIGL